MKAIQISIYLFLFQAFLFIFSQVSAYSIQVNSPDSWYDVSGGISVMSNILQVAGIGTITAVGVGVAAHFLAGTSGLQTLSISILTGYFVGMFYNSFSIFSTISTYLGEFAYILNMFLILLGTCFIIATVYGVAQMGMGGARGYD